MELSKDVIRGILEDGGLDQLLQIDSKDPKVIDAIMKDIDADANGLVHAYEACVAVSPAKYFCDDTLLSYYDPYHNIQHQFPDALKNDDWRKYLPHWYKLDLNQDEVISFTEYRKATDEMLVTPKMIRQMIDHIDSNKDGYLTLTESYAWYQQNIGHLGKLSSNNKAFVAAMEDNVTPTETLNGLMYAKYEVDQAWNELPLKDTMSFQDFWA